MNTWRTFITSIQGMVSLIVLVVALPFLVLGVWNGVSTQQELNTFTATTGTVVGNTYTTTENDGVTSGAYYPTVEFTVNSDQKIRFTDGIGSLPADYNTGDKVAVLYNPKNPKEARINTWLRLWLVPTILTTVGVLPLVILAIWFWLDRKNS